MRRPIPRLALLGALVVGTTGAAICKPALPPGAALLAPAMAPRLLAQCSRAAPAKDGPTWRPAVADVLILERQLPGALTRLGAAQGHDWRRAPDGWVRQYVGVVRAGRRLVYGNFLPKGAAASGGWRTFPQVVCDGGPGFFGVEYDADAHRILRVDFNGGV